MKLVLGRGTSCTFSIPDYGSEIKEKEEWIHSPISKKMMEKKTGIWWLKCILYLADPWLENSNLDSFSQDFTKQI